MDKRLTCFVAGYFLAASFMAGTAQAQSRMYKCVDAKGKTYYTQTPPAECLGRDTEVLSTKSGSVMKRIEGQITPEQQAKRDEERKKKAEADAKKAHDAEVKAADINL